MKYNKAQAGETMTWIVATLVIIVLLFFSVFATSALVKVLKVGERSFPLNKHETQDLLASKSLSAYLLTEDDGKEIFNQINEEGFFNDFNGELAEKLFKGFYNEENDLVVGMMVFDPPPEGGGAKHSSYFTEGVMGGLTLQSTSRTFNALHVQKIYLNENNNRSLELLVRGNLDD